jgi:nucleoid-associated protein YgaU
VRIRPQPDADLPAATEGTPVVRKSEGTASPLGQNTATQVEYFDLKLHRPRAGETYASIAKEQYGSERFEAALAAFNRDRDARLETVAPGRPVYVPPLEQLRRRYGNLIGPDSAAPRSAPAAPSPLSQYTPPSTPPDVVPAGGTVRDSLAKPAGAAAAELPRYRVRTDDSLYLIAKKTLGDGERWRDIWKLNQDLLKGSTQIEIGMVLKLPADAKLAEAP